MQKITPAKISPSSERQTLKVNDKALWVKPISRNTHGNIKRGFKWKGTESKTLKIKEKAKLNRILSGSEEDGGPASELGGMRVGGGVEMTHPEGEGPLPERGLTAHCRRLLVPPIFPRFQEEWENTELLLRTMFSPMSSKVGVVGCWRYDYLGDDLTTGAK